MDGRLPPRVGRPPQRCTGIREMGVILKVGVGGSIPWLCLAGVGFLLLALRMCR